MKRRLITLSILPAILLSSCGELNPVGTYQFLLGKTDDSHIEITAEVTNVNHEKIEGMKNMYLRADLGDELSISSLIEQYSLKYPIIAPVLDLLQAEFADFKELPLYYKVLENKDPKLGNRLAVGSDFIADYIKEQIENETDLGKLLIELGANPDDLNLTPDALRYFFNVYADGKSITFQIPISMNDLELQLFWLGDGSRVSGEYLDRLPGKKGDDRFGTHPEVVKKNGKVISSEVDDINKEFEKEFSNTYLYQDFAKIGSFVEQTVEGKKQYKLYLFDNYEGSKEHIEAEIFTKSDFGDFDVKTTIKLSVNDEGIVNFTHNGKEGKEEGFTDELGNEYIFTNVTQEPYVFRDYHVVNVGLAKI